ncbi:sigma-70 family RNA polymerase sigma factor [Akkermansiaceae bacterium]|nr:sigma-70 family RNA polymerase sigma factor [Akkermansiaceae bacterium]MDA7888153.1 sigma-70 family RNA polymerase sigma factor [Akkermansiaceae bacterium]
MLDAAKFSQLVTESQQRLYAYIFSLSGHTASSWDILQETNLVLWAKREAFKEGTNFNAWAHTVARFQVLAFLRDKTREPLSLLTPEIFEKLEAETDPEFEAHEARLKALNNCLTQLAPAASKIVRWHYEDKLSLQKISERLSMTANAVKQALFRARRNLQHCVESSTPSK